MRKISIILTVFALLTSCYKEDVVPPVITLKGDVYMTLDISEPYSEPGATATDETDGDLTSQINILNDVPFHQLGKYLVSYSVTDNGGNSTISKRTVDVIIKIDSVPPILNLFGPNPLLMPPFQTYHEPGYSAIDYVNGDLTPEVVVTGNVNTSMPGTYFLTYKVVDLSGNMTTKVREVKVGM